MSRPRILVQLDGDRQPSVFDAVVAIDADVEHLLQYSAVQPEQVRDLVYGAMFTRGPADLRNTAVFVGGSDVRLGEELLQAVVKCFFGPMRVSVLLDANGANTTAAAAVLAAARHVPLSGATALVLAATGPVGQRAVRLMAGQGATVRLGSRSAQRADVVCTQLRQRFPAFDLQPLETNTDEQVAAALEGVSIVIAAGAAGVRLLSSAVRRRSSGLRVAVDLNAVPPAGVEGIEPTDCAVDYAGTVCYGAIGVGGAKMKIHKAAIRKLFSANDLVLDAEEIFALGQELG